METLARSLDQEAHPTAGFQDPEAGTCVNGSKRGAGSAPYDYMCATVCASRSNLRC